MVNASSGSEALLYNAPVAHRISLLAALLVVLGVASCAAGQEKPGVSHRLTSINVRGLHRFQPDQVTQVAGLQLGQLVDERELERVSDRLGETGLFTHVHYRYQYSSAGCELEMEVEENDQLLPVTFENFVWFSDPELVSLAGARVPLFAGLLPTAGKLAEQLASALRAILREHGVAGDVEYVPAEASNGRIESFQFRVSGHPVLVDRIDFVGVSREAAADLAFAARPLVGQPYLRSKLAAASRTSFPDVYRAHGYLKAEFSPPQTKIIQDGTTTLVDLSIPVSPGRAYRLSGVRIVGNQVIATEELEPLIRLQIGEPTNSIELREDMDQIQRFYGTKGYIAARIDPSAELDEASASVRYVLKITEGDLYRMGELRIEGLGDYAAQMISSQWQMKSGEPFDQSYVDRFFKFTYRDIGLGSSWKVIPRQSISERDKTVSVTLQFMPKA